MRCRGVKPPTRQAAKGQQRYQLGAMAMEKVDIQNRGGGGSEVVLSCREDKYETMTKEHYGAFS